MRTRFCCQRLGLLPAVLQSPSAISSVTPPPLLPGMSEPTVDMRLERMEDVLSDWSAVCRARAEGCKTLSGKATEITQTNRELWRLEQDLAKCIWADLESELRKAVDARRFETMSAEFLQAFSFEPDIQGIFGVGAPVGEAPTLDIKFRPSLTALPAHAVIKQHIERQALIISVNARDSPAQMLAATLSPELVVTASVRPIFHAGTVPIRYCSLFWAACLEMLGVPVGGRSVVG